MFITMNTTHSYVRCFALRCFVAVLLFASGTLAYATSGHGTVPIQANQDSTSILFYSIDTIKSYPVGPGVTYTHFTVTNSSSKRNCYIYDVDLNNPYIRVEESHATTLGRTESMVAAHQRLDSVGHRSIGSVNCNFWETTNNEGLVGVACTGQVRNSKIGASITNWGLGVAASLGLPEEEQKQELGFLMIDNDGKAWIDQYSWDSWVRIDTVSKKMREANRNRNNPNTNEIVLFNSDLGTNATRSTDDLYEVVFDLTGEWVINQEMHGIVRSTDTTGGTLIAPNQAVLQARGNRKAFLQQAAVGDTIHFTIGIYAALTEEYPNIAQLSAGNCLVMKNGRLRFRNWAEQYNNQNYPRTGFGISADHRRLWMMVMEKPGMYTHEMCSILRYFGASDAMGADGGGSAQFNLGGQIINPTTEANPRAVSNAIFLFSTAPDDEQPASLIYHDNMQDVLSLPSYSSYTPSLRAYNRYDLLISNDYADFTLRCEPASLGTISADGKTFTASAIGGDGILIAEAGNARAEKAVHVEPGNIRIAWDSLICDLTPCLISVFCESAVGDLSVDPTFIDWQVRDAEICKVEEGAIVGLKNGKTMVYGTLGNYTDSISVSVEIAAAQIEDTYFNKDTTLNYSSTRGPAWEQVLDYTLFGKPRDVYISVFTPNTLGIKSATAVTHSANSNKHTSSVPVEQLAREEGSEDNRSGFMITLLPETFTDNLDANSYPFVIEKFKCMLDGVQKNTDYLCTFGAITCVYDSWQEVKEGWQEIPVDARPMKLIIDGQLYILRNGTIYDINGNTIQ